MAYTVIPHLAPQSVRERLGDGGRCREGGCADFDIRCTPGRRPVAKSSRLAPRTEYAACLMTVSVVQHFAILRPRPARRGVVSSIRTTCKNGPAWSNCRATQAHQGRQRMRGHGVKHASPDAETSVCRRSAPPLIVFADISTAFCLVLRVRAHAHLTSQEKQARRSIQMSTCTCRQCASIQTRRPVA